MTRYIVEVGQDEHTFKRMIVDDGSSAWSLLKVEELARQRNLRVVTIAPDSPVDVIRWLEGLR